MRLAEALILRKYNKEQLESFQHEISSILFVAEGQEPEENIYEMLDSLAELTSKQIQLISDIEKTNALTEIEGIGSIAKALTIRQMLSQKQRIINALCESIQYGRSDRRIGIGQGSDVQTISIVELKEISNEIGKSLRELEVKLQQTNWSTELVDSDK